MLCHLPPANEEFEQILSPLSLSILDAQMQKSPFALMQFALSYLTKSKVIAKMNVIYFLNALIGE